MPLKATAGADVCIGRQPSKQLHMTGLSGKVLISMLIISILSHGVTAETQDEGHLFSFLGNVFPNYSFIFNTSVSACQWPGISCIGLGMQQQVQQLNLSGLGLKGAILPNTLGALSSLKSLDLSNNLLTGDVPLDIFNLTGLSYLGLANNRLTGSCPRVVSNFVQLLTLDLSGNLLAGDLPNTLGDLQYLEVLDLHSNNFSGSIPVLGQLSHLQRLDLSSNRISGVVPYAFNSLAELKILNLSRNALTGQITWQLQNLVSLEALDLSENDFDGVLPSFYGLQLLRSISFSSNRFSGRVPTPLTSLLSLQELSVANNNLTGSLPQVPWGTANSSLRVLDCRNNSLNGFIPEGLLALPNLEVVRLAGNNFTGPLPTNVTYNLRELDLQSNSFTGIIPWTITNLPGLQMLELSSNQLGGRIPWDLIDLASMQHVGLAWNAFDDGLLANSSGMVKMLYLNLSFCKLGGPITDSFVSFGSLSYLDLSHNHLNGSIPRNLSQTTNLTFLDLSFNNLSGMIPSELDSLNYLNHVNFSFNNLTGEVPDSKRWATFDSSSFQGNPQLCGAVLNKACPSSLSPVPALNPSNPHRRPFRQRLRARAVVGIVVGSTVACCAILTIFLLLYKRKPKKLPAKEVSKYLSGPVTFETDPSTWAVQVPQAGTIPVIMFEKPLLNLTLADLLQATSNLHKDNQISDGGYGPVYKGVLPGGFEIVVKVLFEGGPANVYEKAAQLEALGKIRHPNLVSLVGYCLVEDERLLVYDFMENGDLQRRLHELPEENQNPDDWTKDTWEHPDGDMRNDELSWSLRHGIALGVARALAFLHHGCCPHLIHRDVNSSNILLDSQYEPHLADCGLAVLIDSEKRSETPVIGGTLGYVPPEYGQMWKASTRGDVYSFGVVLLELVTGKRPTGHYYHDSYGGNLVGWVRALIREKRGYKCLDPKLISTGVEHEMLETLRIGYLCTAELPSKRPTMQQVVGLLKDIQPEYTAL